MRFVFIVMVFASLGGCVRTLPPAATPGSEAPPVDAAALARPLAANQGRLVVDVPNSTVRVHRVALRPTPASNSRWRFVEEGAPLCETPCVVDLPVGNHLLDFPILGRMGERTEPELVYVGPEATVYRRSLDVAGPGRSGMYRTGWIMGLVGLGAGIAGSVVLARGQSEDDRNRRLGGGATLGVGVALLAFGIWLARRGAPTLRPGSSVHFPLVP